MQEQFLKIGAKKRALADAEILVCAPRRKRLPSCGETVLLEFEKRGRKRSLEYLSSLTNIGYHSSDKIDG
jgi:hypothetical protein